MDQGGRFGEMMSDSYSVEGSNRFNTTHWSVVLRAGKDSSPRGAVALERLCRSYWRPLFFFLRGKGYGEDDAQDLTQSFFARLIERNDFGTVDPSRGKFRTFLLTSLTHFVSNERDRARAAKRGGGRTVISLDDVDQEQLNWTGAAKELSPDKLFDMKWATTVMQLALSRLREEMREAGKGAEFDELRGYLTGDPGDGGYAEAGQRLGAPGKSVAVKVHRLRSRYRELVRAEVAETVSSPMDLDEEMRHLHAVLSQ